MAYGSIDKRREYARKYYHTNIKARLSIAKAQKKELVHDDIISGYLNGKSTLKLSDEYGVDKTTIRRVLIKNGVELRDNKKLCEARNGVANPNYNGYEGITGTKWASIKQGAKARNLEFSITKEQAWEKYNDQNGLCALSGIPIVFAANVKEHQECICNASLDRIDSSRGYTIDNVQWVHKRINEMKMSDSQPDFISWCELIVNYNKECKNQL